MGSVGGIVVKAEDQKALAGVTITVIAGGKAYPAAGEAPVKTDAQGVFHINNIPAGNIIVRLKAPSTAYHSVDIAANIVNAAGNFPLANSTLTIGPIGLIPMVTSATGAFKVLLVSAEGSQAPGIKAYLRANVAYVDFSTPAPAARGTIVSDSTSDNTGYLSFKDIPDFKKMAGLGGPAGINDQVTLQIPPADTDKDNVVDFLGTQVNYSVNKLNSYIPTVVLTSGALGNLKIQAASIAALTNQNGNRLLSSTSGPLYITFNLPISKTLSVAHVYDELGKRLATNPAIAVSGNVMTLSFTGLQQGGEYNLSLYATSVVGNKISKGAFGAPFFTPAMQGSKVTAALSRDIKNTKKIIVTFSEPIGTGQPGVGLTGGNAILYFGYNIDGSSGGTGDSVSERGFTSSNVDLFILEATPPGPSGRSGLSSRWTFILPNDSLGNPIPGGTQVDMLFSRANVLIERASGELVPNLTNLTVPN